MSLNLGDLQSIIYERQRDPKPGSYTNKLFDAGVEKIAQKEKLKCDKNVLFMIAKATEGALRDAESLLDQLASFSEGKIKEEDVLTLLGLAPEEMYLSVLDAIREKKGEEIFGQAIPMKRMATADELAAAICFFLSDDASFITGQTLIVDGGETIV